MVFVSQSQYHKAADPNVIGKFSYLPYFFPPNGINSISEENILPYGNALKNNLTSNVQNISEITDYDSSIKFTEYEGEEFLIFESQYISSNGNVLKDGCISYDMMDKYHIGNVMEQSILEMYGNQPKFKLKKCR